MTSPSDIPAAPAPRLVFFDVRSRRDLVRRAAAAAPGARFSTRRHWTEDPGEPRRTVLGGEPGVGLWHWCGTAEEFAAEAGAVLLRLVHPLLARGLPYCLGFSFGPELLAPRAARVGETSALDLEDIGRLLGAGVHSTQPGPPIPCRAEPDGQRSRATARRPLLSPVASCASARPGAGPDAVRLDDAQRAAVEHRRGPARVLAPAGSGKTKTLVSRVVELVDRGCDPSGILMLAFNRKAAEQLEERLAALGIPSTRRLGTPADAAPGRRRRHPGAAPSRPPGVHCATFNAFGYRYQREVMGARIALDHDGRALRTLMARALDSAGISLRELQPRRGSDPVGAFLQGLTRVRAALEPPDQVEVTLECVTETPLVTLPFAPVHDRFTRAQRATGTQSFDDQIYFAVADLLADPAHRSFIQGRFDHVLVDEFQDLNGAQLALVDVLSRPHRRLFVVGDDDQLIYGWRHADPRGILEFHTRMPPRPFSATYTLATNYRCSRAVVQTGARLVAHNEVREAKEIRPRAGAQDGAVRFFGAPSWPERAAAMCAFLRAEKERLGCGWRDLAVLCRYRSQQLPVALALDAAGIPRTAALGGTLFTHPAAVLLRAYLQLARAPDELSGAALAAILARPNRYLSARAIEAVAAATRPWAHVCAAAASEPAAGPRPLAALVDLRTALAAALPPVSEDLVWEVVEGFGLDDLWAAEADAAAAGAPSDGAGPLEVFDSLLLLAETYPDPEVYLRTWDRLRADEEAGVGVAEDTLAREESEQDRAVIVTIHAAKGREYHSVVVPDYDCDVSRWSASEVEEERRVVYVGVTRARDAALFTVDTSRGFVHPFLRELVEPPDPDEHETLSAWPDEGPEEGATDGDALRRLVADRLAEIEVLFPELAPDPAPVPAPDPAPAAPGPLTAATAAAAAPAAPRSASPPAACPASGSAPRPAGARSR